MKRMGVRALVVVLALSLLASPAAAQSDILCDSGTTELGGLVEDVITLMFTLGVVVGVGMFKFNALANMLTFSQGHKHRLKEKKSEVMKGALVLVAVGPAFSFLADNALNMGSCIDFIPWG